METNRILRSLIEGVMEYDGCTDGKLDFLRECGVPVEGVNASKTVVVTLAVTMDVEYLRDHGSDSLEQITDALDSHPAVDGSSCYIISAESAGERRASHVAEERRINGRYPDCPIVEDSDLTEEILKSLGI